jgi:Cation/multidrug efflux pump
MSLSSISIRRPVLATVMSLVLVIFGVVGFTFLGVREFPAVDPAIVSVRTSYPGANARVIETQITTPIEEEVNAVAGIRNITSISRDGVSIVTVEFLPGVDLETATNDVRDKVSGAVGQLPPDADPPQVSKADADSQPITFIGVRSSLRSLLELSAIADNIFRARLQTIPGVSEVDLWGEKEYAMRILLDPVRLAAYRLTPLDVRDALTRSNLELPSGRIEGDLVELTVRTLSRLSTPEEFEDLIIKESGDSLVRLRDVGRAELGALNERTMLRRNGVPMVGVVLRPQPGANYVAIADEFHRRVERIKPELPSDVIVSYGFDVTNFIRASINEVGETIFLAMVLVVAIIFLFLREWRSTFIPIVVIPIALTASFFVMYVAGFSVNVLTLLALVLAIGLVVDDAIVVLENIYAKIEQGMSPREAGLTGTKEIFFAVIATTAALAAVFTPLLFLGGLTGQLFTEFGVVLAAAVVISAFVALTLTPMLSTRMLKTGAHEGWFYRKTEPFYRRITAGYRRSLAAFLRHRWMAVVVLLACGGVSWALLRALPTELAPLEDRSSLRINATAAEGTSYETMSDYMSRLEALVVEKVPEIAEIMTITSPGFGGSASVNSGFIRVTLTQPAERTRSQQEIAAMLRREVRRLPGARVAIQQEPTIGDRRSGAPVQFVIQAPKVDDLEAVLPRFLERAGDDPTFTFVDTNLRFTKPELRVDIDRNRARALGVSVRDVAETLQLALSEQRYGYFILDDEQYQVIGQLQRPNRNQPADLRQIQVRAGNGEMVPLDNLITVRESITPPALYRFNRYASATVSAELAEGKTIGDGIAAMRAIADELLDERFTTELAGQSRDFVDSSSSLLFFFVFALVLIYLVLAAQFESFRDPLIIMLTVPLALMGALFALWMSGSTLNIFSQIGLVMLIGLVTKNGILIVEFANQRKLAGLSVREAIEEAAAARFRPILMTSLSTILGIAPIALALGAGAQSRVPMGMAVVGGMAGGTLLTLFVVPAIYSFISRELKEEEIEIRQTVDEDEPQPELARPVG